MQFTTPAQGVFLVRFTANQYYSVHLCAVRSGIRRYACLLCNVRHLTTARCWCVFRLTVVCKRSRFYNGLCRRIVSFVAFYLLLTCAVLAQVQWLSAGAQIDSVLHSHTAWLVTGRHSTVFPLHSVLFFTGILTIFFLANPFVAWRQTSMQAFFPANRITSWLQEEQCFHSGIISNE